MSSILLGPKVWLGHYDFVDISVDDVNRKCYYVDITNMDVNKLWA